MDCYELTFTISSPGKSIVFMEFSPNGRFLAVGDQESSSLYILDRLAGFHPKVSTVTPAKSTALVWESSRAFYVGLSDGRFVHYKIDLGGNRLVKGAVNSLFYGGFPTTAIALDVESKTLALSVGPDVFVLRRIRATSEFRFVANVSNRFNFKRDPGSPAPPFPRSICFTLNNTLVITFCRRNIASIVLEFDGDSRLHSSFQTAKIDYSGLPLLKAITSASEEEMHWLTRFWVYGCPTQTHEDSFPFLFINGGAATLSGSALGAAVVRDAITRREIQLLEHTAIAGRHVSVMAYHVSNNKYSIATADYGVDATVKIWTARRSFHSQGRSHHGFLTRKGWITHALVVTLVVTMMSKMERLPNVNEISQFCFQAVLIFMGICIRIGYLILDAAEAAVLNAGDALD